MLDASYELVLGYLVKGFNVFTITEKLLVGLTAYVNLFPLSGIHAMLMTIVSLTKPGDTVLSLSPDECGHFATRSIVEEMGRKSIYIPTSNGKIDFEELSDLLQRESIQLIYFDLMSHIETIDIKSIKSLAQEGTIVVYDASHTLGLILGNQFQDPFLEGADVICANTHKTFPGPHRGLILAKDALLGEVIENVVSGKFYSSVHCGTLLAMLVTIFEMRDFGNEYAKQVIDNANVLAENLEGKGIDVARCSDGTYTKNHQVHLLFENREDARTALELLRDSDIVAHLCYRESSGYFVRLGAQEITRRGIADMALIANLITSTINGEKNAQKVKNLMYSHSNKYFSYDAI